MNNEIISTNDMAEAEWDGHSEPSDVRTDMVATREPEANGIEFHVSMRAHTMRDMESLIVEAAASQIVGKFTDRVLAKAIEEKCIALIDAKARSALEAVTTEIVDQPITPKFGDKKPITMREFIGLTGREYLAEMVDTQGNKSTDTYSRHTMSRVQYLVQQTMNKQFKDEIQRATTSVIVALQRDIKATLDAFLVAQKDRVKEALAKSLKS